MMTKLEPPVLLQMSTQVPLWHTTQVQKDHVGNPTREADSSGVSSKRLSSRQWQAMKGLRRVTRFGIQGKLDEAQQILSGLKQMVPKVVLDGYDDQILKALGKLYGLEAAPIQIDFKTALYPHGEKENLATYDLLSVDSLNQVPDRPHRNMLLETLQYALKARIAATEYTPLIRHIEGQPLVIHNREVAKLMKGSYTSQDLKQILKQLNHMGVFQLSVDAETGLVRTSDTAQEYSNMNNQWHSDSMGVGAMQKVLDAPSWNKNLLTNIATLNTPLALSVFDKINQNPGWYREDDSHGLPHIFDPATLDLSWRTGLPDLKKIEMVQAFPPKRQESQGQLLNAILRVFKQTTTEARDLPKEFQSETARRWVANAIVNLANYLVVANTHPETGAFDFAAPSSGSWEEAPLNQGIARDMGLTVVALSQLHDLLYNPNYDSLKEIQDLRADIQDAPNAAYLLSKEQMEAFIEQGQQKIHERVVEPLERQEPPVQHPLRASDMALLSLANTNGLRFDSQSMLKDSQIRLALVRQVKSDLLRENGMLRYPSFQANGQKLHDSYLNLNYWVVPAFRIALSPENILSENRHHVIDHGAEECSSIDGMVKRQTGSDERYAAQWGLGITTALTALSSSKIRLLKNAAHENRPLNAEENQFLQELNQEIDEFVTRSLALVSGETSEGQLVVKSDGRECPPNRVMEAYEAVTDLNGHVQFIPGAHVSAMGTAQLFKGLYNAMRAETMELQRLKS